jgi:hypothetical protein
MFCSDFFKAQTHTTKNKPFAPGVQAIVEGIQQLQANDTKELAIRNARNHKYNEAEFRDWFITWFSARRYLAESESEKGNGRVDLKIQHPAIGKKIIEFKGWWNNQKHKAVEQLCNYLTEFEGDCYIFMINHTKQNIVEAYKSIITHPETGYIPGSWQLIPFLQTGFSYYSTEHTTHGKTKRLYYFIFAVH